MATLLLVRGRLTEGTSFTLQDGEMKLGRDPSVVDIVLPDQRVSGLHARITQTDGRYSIEDSSRNGTWVNERCLHRGERAPLGDFDAIRIAGYDFEFQALPEGPAPEREDGLLPSDDPSPASEVYTGGDWRPGERIEGRWEVEQILRGGMGIVYVVRDHHTGEMLAAKTYRDDVLTTNPDIARRFEREAVAWVNLGSHPNVVRARYVKTIRNKPFLFLEYVAGGNLRRELPSLRLPAVVREDRVAASYSLGRIQDFAVEFCDGMIHLAKAGIVAHRDIKPENCLIGEDERGWPVLKITDFGLAKVFDDACLRVEGPGLFQVRADGPGIAGVTCDQTVEEGPFPVGLSVFATRTGVGAGTPTHMAPEQFDDAKRVDVRADVYAFGVMLFQMVMGRLPLPGRTWWDYKRLHQTITPPRLPPQAEGLGRIVARCLAKDPAGRYSNFAEIRSVLARTVVDPLAVAYGAGVCLRTDLPPPATAKDLTQEELLLQARSFVELRRHRAALAVLSQVLERDPGQGEAWLERGVLFLEVFQMYQEALADLERARQLGQPGTDEPIAVCRDRLASQS